MGKVLPRALATATLSAGIGFFACREPTQITLTITTDAGCPEDDARPRLNDVVVISGRAVQLGGSDLVANAQTTQCSFAEPNLVGTLVFLPDGKDDPSVEVLVVAGVQRDATDDKESLSAGSCLAVVNDPDPSKRSIEGLPCIVARRRLTFVSHNSLALPINLDRRCIGQECGADLTCFEGNCVNPNLSCTDGGGCTEPKGCDVSCDDSCASHNGTCVDGTCQCDPCEDALCRGSCVDDQCLCAPAGGVCSSESCASGGCACGAEQSSTCVDEQCGCACDEDKCAAHCAKIGKINPHCSDAVDSIECLCDDPMGQGGAGPGGAGPGGAGHGGAGHGGGGGAGQGGSGTTSSSTTTTTTTSSTSSGGMCDPVDCIGPCGEGVFNECTTPTTCSCTCHQTSCNSYCQTMVGPMFAGSCSTEPFGTCSCYMISGTGTGGMMCPPATAPDCSMCDTACSAQMAGCSGGACADVTGGNTSVSCMCH